MLYCTVPTLESTRGSAQSGEFAAAADLSVPDPLDAAEATLHFGRECLAEQLGLGSRPEFMQVNACFDCGDSQSCCYVCHLTLIVTKIV